MSAAHSCCVSVLLHSTLFPALCALDSFDTASVLNTLWFAVNRWLYKLYPGWMSLMGEIPFHISLTQQAEECRDKAVRRWASDWSSRVQAELTQSAAAAAGRGYCCARGQGSRASLSHIWPLVVGNALLYSSCINPPRLYKNAVLPAFMSDFLSDWGSFLRIKRRPSIDTECWSARACMKALLHLVTSAWWKMNAAL